MTLFRELWRTSRYDSEANRYLDERSLRFPEVLKHAPHLHLWQPGMPFPNDKVRLLIGIATWSGYDMLLLDLLMERQETREQLNANLWVDVFDVAECDSEEEFKQFVPTIRRVTHTPVVGVWLDGRLADSDTGAKGRALVVKYAGIDSEYFSRLAAALHNRNT